MHNNWNVMVFTNSIVVVVVFVIGVYVFVDFPFIFWFMCVCVCVCQFVDINLHLASTAILLNHNYCSIFFGPEVRCSTRLLWKYTRFRVPVMVSCALGNHRTRERHNTNETTTRDNHNKFSLSLIKTDNVWLYRSLTRTAGWIAYVHAWDMVFTNHPW